MRTIFLLLAAATAGPAADRDYWVCVSNEKSGEVAVIDGADARVMARIPAGKRPRGLHPSPDGKLLYVAVSGTPAAGPPRLDAKGKPIFEKAAGPVDPTADGIAVLDLQQ